MSNRSYFDKKQYKKWVLNEVVKWPTNIEYFCIDCMNRPSYESAKLIYESSGRTSTTIGGVDLSNMLPDKVKIRGFI